MIDTPWTKGPWIAGHLGDPTTRCECASICADGYFGAVAVVKVGNGLPVGDGGNDSPPKDEAVANMHLISASPDMAEALDELIASIDGRAPGWFHEEFGDELKAARAALAKARGEQT